MKSIFLKTGEEIPTLIRGVWQLSEGHQINSEKNDLTGKFLSLFFPEFIKEQRHTNLTAENIIKNSIRKINDDNGGGIYILKIKDYLHLVEFTEKCHELLKDRISSFYNNTYKPLNENLKQATNIFNMEFD